MLGALLPGARLSDDTTGGGDAALSLLGRGKHVPVVTVDPEHTFAVVWPQMWRDA